MSQTPNQKNIVHGTITAGGNAHIGDKITYILNQEKLEIPVRLTNFIPTDASHVVGRDDELAKTHQKLRNNKPTILVNGIGGIGKTTLALKYMVTYTPEYQHVAWLNAASGVQSAFIQDIALLDALHLRREVEACINAAQPDKAFDLVFKRLNDLITIDGANTIERVKHQILVVLDNANDLADLLMYKKYFDMAQIHFLITSRANPEGWQKVKVESLPKEQALELFKNIYPSVSATNEELDTVLSQLFYHTLLIDLVAKAAKVNSMDFDHLRKAINEKFIYDPDLQKRKVNVENHSSTIGEEVKRAKIEEYIWLIFKNVKDLPDTAKEIMRAFALLPPATPFNEDFLSQHFAQWQITEDVYDILDISLVERGWLDKIIDIKISYKMNPLIADVVVKELRVDKDFATRYIEIIAQSIYYNNTNPKHNFFDKNKKKAFAERLAILYFAENIESTAKLLDNLNILEENLGSYLKAIEYGEQALRIAEAVFEEYHPTIATCQCNLGWAYQLLGNYKRAISLLETALASNIKKFGIEHPEVAIKQSNLAVVYKNLGDYDRAASLLETALSNDIKNFGLEHPEVAIKQSNLANVYQSLGDYKKAAVLLEIALDSDVKNFGIEHRQIAIKQSNLGNVYRNIGDYTRANELIGRALVSTINNFGVEHPDVAICKNNLAWVYKNTGREVEAKILWQEAYQNYLKNLGGDHPHTIILKQLSEM